MPIDVANASIVPERAPNTEAARPILARDGAVLLGGIASESAIIDLAATLFGPNLVRIERQFETTKDVDVKEGARIAALSADARGRKPYFYGPSERMIAHNDGFLFADLAPDYMFLWCKRPAQPAGGESFLIDGGALVRLLGDDPETADLARFCWDVDIDHSDPSSPQQHEAPIARRLPNGRLQIRNHHNIAARPGASEDADARSIGRWQQALRDSRDRGAMFQMEAGDAICFDNYRMLHGRDSFDDPGRQVHAFWVWTKEAIAVPSGTLDLANPGAVLSR
ncbi:MAG: TauD/TfdA family dioxygenase [Alphaproteobacteria bacterium]|nr:TauD/TfdA family dioxygenase [Alphaproteobacteria bacterium]